MNSINSVSMIDQMRQMVAEVENKGTNNVGESFGSVFTNALNQVNQLNLHADALKKSYVMGDPNVSLADAMIESQKASLGLQGTMMVRNKFVQAYQDIMNMSV